MVNRARPVGARVVRPLASMVAAALVALAGNACGAPLDEFFSNPDRGWTEIEAQLPAPPTEKSLVEFYVSPNTSFRFALDRDSITIGSDGVVRYTLVATSDRGVRNIRFEGLRCQTNEFKVYAFASAEGKWEKSRTPSWKRVAEASGNREEAALAKDSICENGLPFSADDIVKRLKASARGSIPY
jgi:hypothetical protein